MDQKNCAIVFFTRTSLSESRKKKWFSSYEKNLHFAESLISSTRKTLLSTGLDVLEIDETQQVGSTIGEKMANAFKTAFAQGYKSVILVGNDTVGLETSHIFQAKEALLDSPQVFGANSNGGVYLIGFQKETFYTSQFNFIELPWQTPRLWDAICKVLHVGTIPTIEVLSDVNTKIDLIQLLQDSRQHKKIKELLNFLLDLDKKPIQTSVSSKKLIGFFQTNSLRGPPVKTALS